MEKKNKNKKIIIYISIIATILILVGATYAFFTYMKIGGNNKIVAGDIYLNFIEDNEIELYNVFPETYEEAMANEENELTFEIRGKNTSTKDINYAIKINQGDDINGMNRFLDEHIRIYLECDGEVLVNGVRYNEWDDTIIALDTINAGQETEIVKTYLLKIWIDENILISDTEPNSSYTTSVYQNSFASIKVKVEGKTGELAKSLKDEIEEEHENNLTQADAFGNRYISGTKAGITNNYVKFSDKLWRIVGINADGTIKLITESAMTYMPWDSTGNTDYATSEIHEWLNDEFLNTLDQEQIVTGTVNYTGLSSSMQVGEIKMTQAKVSLLSVFDFVGVIGLDLTTGDFGNMADHYLMNGQEWWLNALCQDINLVWLGTSKSFSSDLGTLSVSYEDARYIEGVRPVINLLSTTRFIEGDGSKENPYVIESEVGKGDKYNYNNDFVSKLSNLTEADMNGTRYVTGLTEDNYVWYSGKLWRVVALNGDGTVKIVTQNNITSIAWDINNSNNYSTSQVRRWLNNDFLNTLYKKGNLVEKSNFDYGYGKANDKVGLLTLSEFYGTGGSQYNNFTNIYLNNNYYWWLMTPYTIDNNSSGVWNVYYGGSVSLGLAVIAYGVRPSVNLISEIRISSGVGTATNPYRLEGDIETGASSEYLNTRISGEYVKFNDTVYRIVGIETINNQKLTKITMADYSKNGNTIDTEETFGNSGVFSKTTGIGLYLNNWYGGLTNKEMIATDSDGVKWYQGDDTGYDYTKAKLGTGISATIGLPYYGEMFSTQFGPGYEDSVVTWFMTKWNNSGSYVWDVGSDGDADYGDDAGNAFGVRPSMYLKSNVKIKDTNGDGDVGNGTANYPYEIAID